MKSSIQFRIRQNKGEHNSVRVFVNNEFIDEFDTSPEWEIKNYEITLCDGEINQCYIEVVNTKTVVENAVNNKILSSNDVHLDTFTIYDEKIDQIKEIGHLTFKRKSDPIYEIWCKQNNKEYAKFFRQTRQSSGNGMFAVFWLNVTYKSIKWKNDNYTNVLDYPWHRPQIWIDWDPDTKQDFYLKNDIFDLEQCRFVKTRDEIYEWFMQYFNKIKATNINENFQLNMNEVLDFYEN